MRSTICARGRQQQSSVQGYDRRQEAEAATSVDAARKQIERPPIVYTSLYPPEPVYEALCKIAFEERLKIRDVVLGDRSGILCRAW
jgi:hypothetical protein